MARLPNSGARKAPMRGPKTSESPAAAKKPAAAKAPAAEQPAPSSGTKLDESVSGFRRTLASGKPVGTYVTAGANYVNDDSEMVPAPDAISKNTAHIEALLGIADDMHRRLNGITKEADSRAFDDNKKRYSRRSTLEQVAPAHSAISRAKNSLNNAYLAHLAGDAVSSTTHLKEGAQHLVDAVNHLESGEVWGGISAKGSPTSMYANWRKDNPKDWLPLGQRVSVAGPIHTKIAAAVNDYIDHVKKVATTNPEIAAQLPDSDTEHVSYPEADSYSKSPLINRVVAAKKAKTPQVDPNLSEEEQELANAKAAGIKNVSDKNAKDAAKVKDNFNTFKGVYDSAKKTAAAQIGTTGKRSNKVYTQEMFDEEFEPIGKEEEPKDEAVSRIANPFLTPKTMPTRNTTNDDAEPTSEAPSHEWRSDEPDGPSPTRKSSFDSVLSDYGYIPPKERRKETVEPEEDVEVPDEKIEEMDNHPEEAAEAARAEKETAESESEEPTAPTSPPLSVHFSHGSGEGK